MKREEKNRQTLRRIMDGALTEFSRQGYAGSSINAICAAQDISKGIVYHYFENKDDLFLACVKECFDLLTDHLRSHMPSEEGDTQEQLEMYFAARTAFFRANPVYQRIFCEAVITPAAHMQSRIQTQTQAFDLLNIQILTRLLEPVALRPHITKSDVIEAVRQIQDVINARYQMAEVSASEFKAREDLCKKALNILLYGVVDRKGCDHV